MHAPDESEHAPSGHRVLDQLRDRIRLRHYSIRTETRYVHRARRYVCLHHKRRLRGRGAAEVEAFLTHPAVDGDVAAATRNQALPALPFLYREVLAVELPWLDDVVRAKRQQRTPVVRSRAQV